MHVLPKRILIAIAILFIAVCASAQEDASLKTKLIELETNSWNAWKARDPEYFKTFLSDDHLELGPGGPAGKALVVASVASPKCVVKSFEIDHFTMRVLSADTAVLVYHAKQDTTCNGNPVPSPVWATSVYVRRGDRWLNAVYEHTPAAN